MFPFGRRARTTLCAALLWGATTLLGACAATPLRQASEPDVARARLLWPNTTLADLHQGRSLYLARCSGCHQPVSPERVSVSEWPGHVDEMKGRAHLDDREASLVVRFLVTMANAEPETSRGPLPASPLSASSREPGARAVP